MWWFEREMPPIVWGLGTLDSRLVTVLGGLGGAVGCRKYTLGVSYVYKSLLLACFLCFWLACVRRLSASCSWD